MYHQYAQALLTEQTAGVEKVVAGLEEEREEEEERVGEEVGERKRAMEEEEEVEERDAGVSNPFSSTMLSRRKTSKLISMKIRHYAPHSRGRTVSASVRRWQPRW